MATIVNERDVMLRDALTRDNDPRAGKYLTLTASGPVFRVSTGGTPLPSSLTITALPVNITGGTVTWGITAGTLTGTGLVRTLAFADMPVDQVTITASITDLGQTYTTTQVISKILDGSIGTRGAGAFYATGSAWSDATADAATPGANITDDTVTIFNSTTFSETRRWTGTSWTLLVGSINGGMILPDTVTAAMLKAGIIDVSKFATALEPITMVTTVPGTKSTNTIFNTTDGKLYRWNGSNYTTLTPAVDISGTLTSSQIADLAAAKLTGQIVSTQITDDAISTPKIAAGAIVTAKIAAGAITADKLSIGTGANLIRLSTFPQSVSGWTLESNNTGYTAAFIKTTGIYTFGETAHVYFPGNESPSGTYTTIRPGDSIQVTAGKYYEASIYLNTHRCTAYVALNFFDVSGNYISGLTGGSITGPGGNGDSLAGYSRSAIVGVAPTGAATAKFYIVSIYNGQVGPYTFFTRAFMAEANQYQNVATPWTPSGVTQIDGGQITANTVTANEIAANAITASEISADAVTAGKIAASAISAREIAALAITTEKLAITSHGSALNADPNCLDITAWTSTSTVTFVAITDGLSGSGAIRSSTTPNISFPRTRKFSMTAGKTYRVQGNFKSSGGASKTAYFRVERYNSAGSVISEATGYENVAVPNTWITWENVFVAEAGTVNAAVSMALNWNGVSDGSYIDVQNVRVEEVLPGTLIQDGAITTNKILAGSITAVKIAAGSITSDKLVVSGKGTAINDDPFLEDYANSWAIVAGSGTTIGSASTVTGVAGYYYYYNATGASDSRVQTVKAHPVDPNKVYLLTANLYAGGSNNRNMYIYVNFYDGAGSFLSTSWGGGMSGYVYGSPPPVNVWSRQGDQFGLGTARPIPAAARTMKIGVWFQYSGGGSSSDGQAAQDIRVERVSGSTLIEDGAITTDKIVANAITAVKINAGAVTATKISVSSLDAVSATIGLLRTASSGARTEIADNVIRVYDSSNVLRVKIGNLA